MKYTVEVKPSAEKELLRVPEHDFIRLSQRVQSLADDQRPRGAIRLKAKAFWRIRVGTFRIIYRIASLMVALYYRRLNGHLERVCLWNGYPQCLHCKTCQHKPQGKRCDWSFRRRIADLDGEIVDEEGYTATLLDSVASDKVADMPDLWYDINQLRGSLPTRLVEIGHKKLEGIPLTHCERIYLCKLRKRLQKNLL